MPKTPEQIEHLERIKRELGIDERIGARISEQTEKRGRFNGIWPISKKKGKELAENTFNPVLQDVIDDEEP